MLLLYKLFGNFNGTCRITAARVGANSFAKLFIQGRATDHDNEHIANAVVLHAVNDCLASVWAPEAGSGLCHYRRRSSTGRYVKVPAGILPDGAIIEPEIVS